MASGRVPNTNITFFMWNELLFIVITIIIEFSFLVYVWLELRAEAFLVALVSPVGG